MPFNREQSPLFEDYMLNGFFKIEHGVASVKTAGMSVYWGRTEREILN